MRVIRTLALAATAMCGLHATEARAAGPRVVIPVTSGDTVGLSVDRTARGGALAAVLGMWSDDGALELGGFREGPSSVLDPQVARAAEIVSGRPMRSTGVRLSGALRRTGALLLTVEARRQQVSDIGAALGGDWRTSGDTRLTFGGKLKF